MAHRLGSYLLVMNVFILCVATLFGLMDERTRYIHVPCVLGRSWIKERYIGVLVVINMRQTLSVIVRASRII